MNERKLPLNDWRLRAPEATEWLPARVPGCVHTDLLRNGKMKDPFYGTNEKELQWIDKQDWDYETMFDVPADVLAESGLELVFEGLDTYADVDLNDHRLFSADNMFRTWTADVKPFLLESGNKLAIRFRSPIREGLDKLQRHGFGLPAPNDDSETGGVGDKKLSMFSRKAPYHYGWDWGPRFVTSGIWRPVYLRSRSGLTIRDMFIRQDRVSPVSAQIAAVLEIETEAPWEGNLSLSSGSHRWETPVILHAGIQTVSLPAEIPAPSLWWCRGYGEPVMHAFKAAFTQAGIIAAEKTVRAGLRDIKLVRNPDTHGTSFYFELNGVPVFAKGANHVPGDSFATEMTDERYRHEIATAVESNFNMLRVWGGGIYEQDIFYELCDEYGMLVWQDFIFACSMYPGDEAFVENVRREAEDNVRRLRNHPCIALWCGNNEIDGAWAQYTEDAGWGWKKLYTAEQRGKIWADYEAVFHKTLPEVVERLIPGADYWPSSPMQALTGDHTQHATTNSTSGDIHFWSVWHASEPFENYNLNIGRFMSEYGFQSFPEYRTVRTYAAETEMELESEVMLHHQRHKSGNRLIKEYSDIYCKEPKDFPSFLYMSQVLQAEAMKMAIEAHRRRKNYCMGTLYWQINDCWPVASWSSMDYYGRWKAVQYYARKSCKDVLLSIAESEGETGFHLISDLLSPLEGSLSVRLLDFQGRLLKETSQPVSMEANTAERVFAIPTQEWIGGETAESLVLVAEFSVMSGEILDRTEYYFVPAKQLALEEPHITVTENAGAAGPSFTFTASRLAKQVYLETETEGIFSENFFDLVPGLPTTVTFRKRDDGAIPFVPAAPVGLSVRSMFDFIKR
ncbi:beta-galactosidase [Paenibacillus darwinianus]|uniref:beta-mannosidase n=1 Tax=Paenibacillus darwinianus TaxID=1380763 RepID=A0A9W5RZK6_9BACL|nr:glycoside hydrolase family 2 protein [Paenibacillus darwinianus]EXX86460.1 beta-galactosidase [Paenibacillus darwinianus]EXX91049.1 beta-galactosidase [Paenibacillus darwinianus]EXX92009.1 beta-galactosidase [Paenibacillus darwinianus]